MKKTLLFFLFLLPSLFYAQISSIIHCAGDNVFDLTSRYEQITGNANPAETTVKYYAKDTYAHNDEYAIEDPQHFVTNERSQTIHYRIITNGQTRVIGSFSLVLNSAVNVAYANVNYTVCTNSTLTIGATEGKSPYQYSLDGVNYQPTNKFENIIPGTYTIYVRDAYNCIGTFTKVIEPVILPTITTTVKSVRCNGSNDGSMKIIASGGSVPYSYSLNQSSFQGTDTFNNLSAGMYNVTVKDNNGCMTTMYVAITQPMLLTATVSTFDQSIFADVFGGTSPYSYTLEKEGIIVAPPQSTNTFTNLSGGIYNVRVQDANNCILSSAPVYVAPTSALSATAVTDGGNCFQPIRTITVNAVGGIAPYKYSIDNGTNYIDSNVFNNLSAGIYTINVKDAQNSTASFSVVINPPLVANAVITKLIDCSGNASIRVTASGGSGIYYYSINNGESFQASEVFENLTAGTYHFKIKDSNDCSITTNDIVLVQPLPLTATFTYDQITDCSSLPSTTIIVNATGGKAPYQYSINNLPYQSGNSYYGAVPGHHVLHVKDANGCVFTTPLIIESPVSLTAAVSITKAVNCGEKDSVTITANGGQPPYVYSFDGSNTFSDVNTSSNLTTGTQTLFVRDSNGCYTTIYVTIEQTQALSISTVQTDTSTPNGNDGSLIITATGGMAPYTYSLLNNNIILFPEQISPTFNNLAPGNYGIIVKDAKGCTTQLTQVTILGPQDLIAFASVTSLTCNDPTATVTVSAFGGSGIYEYSIDNGTTYTYSPIFTGLVPGNYIITVKDSQSSIYTMPVMIIPINPVFVNATITSLPNCLGYGTIAATTSGGQPPYLYSFDGGAYSHSDNYTAVAGVHTITVLDSYGCTQTIAITMEESLPIVATVIVENQTITVIATGGNGIYEYSIDLTIFQPGNVFTNLPYGIHQVFVRDQYGCITVLTVSLDPPAPLIDGKDTLTVEFKPGQTLVDLVVEGQNIKWYSSQNALAGKTNKKAETALPLTTILVNGTTYYASQTIDGIESKERLAVTAKLNISLATPDFTLPEFSYYPNPVHHTLNISNNSNIDEIEIFSVTGKSVLIKKINNDHSEIDLSNVASGVYFLKVKADGQTKTIKILKK